MYTSIAILVTLLISLLLYCFILIINSSCIFNCHENLNFHIENITVNKSQDTKEIPNIKSKCEGKKNIHVPKFMLELYEKNKNDGDLIRADVVRSLIPKHAGQVEDNEVYDTSSESHILVFDLPSTDEDETFISAELKVLTVIVVDTNKEIGIKRKLQISIYDDYLKNLLGYQELQIHHLNNTWLTFDLTKSIHEILKSNSKTKFVSVVITILDFMPDKSGTFKLSLMPHEENFEFDYPVLLMSYASIQEKKIMKRVKRSIEDDYEEETNKLWNDDETEKKLQIKKLRRIKNNCRRRPLYVDFAEINYDTWIIQPKGYEAFQCMGRCFYPVADHLNPTKHAIVQALLHSVSPAKVPRSCCVPTVLDSISILYVDLNGVLTYRYAYKDMVVIECGCR